MVSNAFAYYAPAGVPFEDNDACIRATLDEPSDVFLGMEQLFPDGRSHYAGSLMQIALASEKRAIEEQAWSDARRARLFLINLSGATRFIIHSARVHRISIAPREGGDEQ